VAMKSNDDIPADEMLLAEALAAAKAGRKKWGRDYPFLTKDRTPTQPGRAYAVCALGALHLSGAVKLTRLPSGYFSLFSPVGDLEAMINGNDTEGPWLWGDDDRGESLGWAFRCAMTQESE